ncbi:MAG: GNAT family N-acetyltransferase [Alphaproteobacteria bacterium]|nr:GNAT family N-acetyltransferase [Alphaproteobacteria bacterium]MCB9928068.1 GNAT family N-acetyltransferase [Alphaproteobacteria bacterium]
MADGLGGEAWTEASFRALLGGDGSVGWIAGGAGLVLARAIAGEAEILTIGVHPAARRQGVARGLLGACYALLPALGAERLVLEVAVDNLPAQALYRSEGFAVVGRRPGYYRRGAARIDALVMARSL